MKPTPYIEKVLKEFDEKFSTPAILGERGSEEECCNCGEDLSLETYEWFDNGYTLAIDDIKPFLRTAFENYGKEIVGALKKADNISLPNDMWDEWEDGYHEANTVAQKVVEDISGIKK